MEVNERRVSQQLRNFERALTGYDKKEPLARYLTRFFKENKQMGSSDRKMTSRFCYNYFRLGNAYPQENPIMRLVVAEYLCEQHSDLVSLQHPELARSIQQSLSEKVEIASQLTDFDIEKLFPLDDGLSTAIDRILFLQSHFIQPDLFIRIKRGQEEKVQQILQREGAVINSVSEQTIALPNGSKLQHIRGLNGLYEVQDRSSQYTLNFMKSGANESWWDACAASGGKSLLFLDRYPTTKLLVSDIRLSILRNLDERFIQANITQTYRKKVVDLTDADNVKRALQDERFDGIIVDAPCSGSGTWGRTPEMMQSFDADRLQYFTDLQKQIVAQTIPFLKTGKPLIYITCSVYEAENEAVINYIVNTFGMHVEKMEVIKGYESKADSMFAARLLKV
ncbi:RsmB/NOP family class I SAM-dependent RNA methyltransferase [Sphingobacterium faecale]|uniref:RsmB/NOP family class I SAM-dependent RNA methyltransferase n=1 Tax=Sphingobacterium faecale TaxID=2803775 RepID=A0ABS1R3C5_9SPHI|nr:RsmB/NOP family class I SAM-dependent RNA methyltransferase [Sphingobacterium faecale]MBL1409212.1 RsmB/NOP family class I SAM-dependent RNA methyltransferase [Sphingobacterium faecale]